MNDQFCPDCGEHCQPGSNHCPECKFPLELVLVAESGELRIDKTSMKDWRRVAQLLKRNGLRLKTTTGSSWYNHPAWWVLPGAGVLMLVISIMWGPSVVDNIWPPPIASRIVDLNAPADTAGIDDDDAENVSFLKEAFATTDEQKLATEQENLDFEEFVDKPILSLEEIREKMEQRMVLVRVKNKTWRGTLVRNDTFLVDKSLLADAFKRENRTVNEDRTIEERAVYIVPYANKPGEEELACTFVVDGSQLNLGLLSAEMDETIDDEVDYRYNFMAGERVWVTKYVGGRLFPEETTIQSQVDLGGEEEINAWNIESDLGPVHAGSPVFDKSGNLKGILIMHDNVGVVMPMVTLRERAPLIYKEIK